MKVICIDADAYPDTVDEGEYGLLEEGKVYEVEDVYFQDDFIWFTVNDDKADYAEYGYWENCFARCSNVDEEKIKESKGTEIYI